MDLGNWLTSTRSRAAAAHLTPDGDSIVIESTEHKKETTQKTLKILRVPPDHWVSHILLWPFFASLVVIIIREQVHRRKMARSATSMPA
jgi:hypothetical protein